MFRRKKAANQAEAAGFDKDMVVVVDQSVNPYLVMFHDPAGFRAEQVRGLRNRLVAMNPDGEPKTLVVSSAVRGEGKTIAALNLAMAFAELERHRVVIVDADLRRPSCERFLNLNAEAGLTDVLLGHEPVDKLLRPAGYRQLMLLGAGSRVDNPAEVLSSSRLEQLVQRLKENFQYVVIDAPPVLPSTDAGVLSAAADGTVMVIRLEHSQKKQSRDAVRTLADMGGNVLGTFVTEIRGRDPDSDSRLAYDSTPEDERE
ncbi:MAG TPA: polysaccharide biosynthesis tyrosine autokinase [Planctomycetes bacterium]|nr:polysaccharide biosynthesis tyrosine autokinase [Planctomycetota bacterium]